MSIEIYPSDFSTRYELTHAISVQMTVYYNDIGKLQIVAPVSDYNITALTVGNMVYDTDRSETYIIVNMKCDTDANRITVNGYTSNWILNKRCITTSYTLTTIESGVYAIINANLRSLTRLSTAAATGLTESTNAILYGGQILDTIIPYLEEQGLGHKMIWNPSTLSHTFKIYKGSDLTSGIHKVVFSEEQGTAQELVINDDDSTLKNVAYIIWSITNDNGYFQYLKEVGTATGDARRELWIDNEITWQEEEQWSETEARAAAEATKELAQRIRRKSFSVTIDPEEFGVIYNLGDIISCVSVRFGISFNARITGVKYKMDTNSTTTEVILGDPILTALGELKLNG